MEFFEVQGNSKLIVSGEMILNPLVLNPSNQMLDSLIQFNKNGTVSYDSDDFGIEVNGKLTLLLVEYNATLGKSMLLILEITSDSLPDPIILNFKVKEVGSKSFLDPNACRRN